MCRDLYTYFQNFLGLGLNDQIPDPTHLCFHNPASSQFRSFLQKKPLTGKFWMDFPFEKITHLHYTPVRVFLFQLYTTRQVCRSLKVFARKEPFFATLKQDVLFEAKSSGLCLWRAFFLVFSLFSVTCLLFGVEPSGLGL